MSEDRLDGVLAAALQHPDPRAVTSAVRHSDVTRDAHVRRLLDLLADPRDTVLEATAGRLSEAQADDDTVVGALAEASRVHRSPGLAEATSGRPRGGRALARLHEGESPTVVTPDLSGMWGRGGSLPSVPARCPRPARPAGGGPVGDGTSLERWAWGLPSGTPRDAGEMLVELRQGRPNDALPKRLVASTSELEPVVAAVCPVCELIWCDTRREDSWTDVSGSIMEYDEMVGMYVERRHRVRYPCNHVRTYARELRQRER